MEKIKNIKVNKKGSTLFILFAFLVLSITILGYTYDLCRVMYYKVYLKNTASVVALSITNRCHYINSKAIDLGANMDGAPIGVMVMPSPIDNELMSNDFVNAETSKINNDTYKDYVKQIETSNLPYYNTIGTDVPSRNFVNVTQSEAEAINPQSPPINMNFNVVYANKDYVKSLLKAQQKNDFNKNLNLTNVSNGKPTDSDWNGKDFIISLNEADINRRLSTSSEGITQAMVNAYVSAYLQSEVGAVYGDISRLNRYINGKDGKNGEVEIYLVGYVKHFFLGSGMFSNMKPYSRIYTVVMAQPQVYVENLSLVDNNIGNSIYNKPTQNFTPSGKFEYEETFHTSK